MVPRIQCVCGLGCGSSLMLRMAVDDALRKHGLEAETITGDIGTCLSNPCDAIFVSRELAERLVGRTDVEIVVIDDFLDSSELERKTIAFMNSFR